MDQIPVKTSQAVLDKLRLGVIRKPANPEKKLVETPEPMREHGYGHGV